MESMVLYIQHIQLRFGLKTFWGTFLGGRFGSSSRMHQTAGCCFVIGCGENSSRFGGTKFPDGSWIVFVLGGGYVDIPEESELTDTAGGLTAHSFSTKPKTAGLSFVKVCIFRLLAFFLHHWPKLWQKPEDYCMNQSFSLSHIQVICSDLYFTVLLDIVACSLPLLSCFFIK